MKTKLISLSVILISSIIFSGCYSQYYAPPSNLNKEQSKAYCISKGLTWSYGRNNSNIVCFGSSSDESLVSISDNSLLKDVSILMLGISQGMNTNVYNSTSTNDLTNFSTSTHDLTNFNNSTSECTSDYDCGYGNKCVKKPYSGKGICMKVVNNFGVQKNYMPKLNTAYPNMNSKGGCNWNSDCPIGFRCDRRYKQCVK